MNNLFINKYNINTILDNNNNTVLCLLKNYYQFHMQHKIYMIEFNYMLKSKPNFQNLENIIKFEIKKNDKTPELEDLIKQYNNTNSIELLQEISDFIELHGFEFNTELDIGKEYKCTLLEWACEKGCLDIVKKLAYEDKYNVNYIFDYHGETPWMVAYKNHHLGVADYLVQQDAIIDKEFKDKVDKEENPEKYKQEKIRVLKSEMEEMKKMMEKMQKMSIFKTDFNEMEEIASKIGFSYLDKFNENLKLFSQQISSLNNELSMLEGEKQKK